MEGTVVKRASARAAIVLVAGLCASRPGLAQTETAPPPAADAAARAASGSPQEHNWAVQFVRDVGSDYVHYFSKENAVWFGVGGAAALAIHPADDNLSEWAQENNVTLAGGATYGSQWLHIPVAMGVWGLGAAAGSGRVADTGRDLLRAQISVVSWTYAIKLAARRTRPNGDPNSFPSGHSSTSFATAMVLQEHFGWKAGIPAFAAAAYTGVERVADNQHWASDVIMGAADLMLMDLSPDSIAYDEANEVKRSVQRGASLTRQLLAFERIGHQLIQITFHGGDFKLLPEEIQAAD
jgi:membrane-associated phospholipid phosphatase